VAVTCKTSRPEGPRVTQKNRAIDLPIRVLHAHPRLWIALALGVAGFVMLPPRLSLIARVLIGWDFGVLLFLVLIYRWMKGLTAEQLCAHYAEEDPTGPIILVAVTGAALLSLLAIVEPLATLHHALPAQRAWRFALAVVTLIESWVLVPTMFTMHYADMFYSARPQDRPLAFPRTDMPGFWDFAYFSFTIAAACQTADVSTTQTSIRRVVIVHEIISFAFNVAILGFAINITAGLMST
jgi:uncharacterized membrane protein